MNSFIVVAVLELVFSAVVHDIVDGWGVELHGEYFEQKGEYVSKDGVAWKHIDAALLVDGSIEGEEVPAEHDGRSNDAAAHYYHYICFLLLGLVYFSFACGGILLF